MIVRPPCEAGQVMRRELEPLKEEAANVCMYVCVCVDIHIYVYV